MSTATQEQPCIDAEVVTDIVHQPAAASPILMSPGALREQIARDKELRLILTEYVENEMVEGHHYFYMSRVNDPKADLKPGEKASLKQDGAFMFLNLFKYTPGNVRKNIIRTDDGHFTVEAEAPIYDGNGRLVATGDGSCSTRETKYAYRRGERVCPDCQQPAIMTDNKSTEGGFYCWAKKGGCGAKFRKGEPTIVDQVMGRVDNPDLADVENTVLKMAIKRATVAAVRKLPLVSELFSPDSSDDDPTSKKQETKPQSKPRSEPSVAAQAPADDNSGPQGSVKTAVELSTKLQKEYGVDFESLSMQFLPEGVAKFSDLTDEQAAESVKGLSALLTTKVAEAREARK